MVEVAEAGGDVAAGEPAPPVPGPDQRGESLAGPVRAGRQRLALVEEGAGDRVARRDPGSSGLREPAPVDQDRLGAAGRGDLDETVIRSRPLLRAR